VSRVLLVCWVLVAGFAAPAGALVQSGQEQEERAVTLAVDDSAGALSVRVGDILTDGGLRDALHSGLPLRILFEVELWQDRFFDSQRGAEEWRATVLYEPLDRTYQIETTESAQPIVATSLAEAGRVLSRVFTVSLRPAEEGRYYYDGQLVVETLSLSDLEELQRWLRGDLGPAATGERSGEDAMGSGVRRIVVRMLGLPARRFKVRTPTFEIGGR